MAHIDYYFSTLSPFTYMAGTNLEKIAARHNASIRYKPMDILDVFSNTGGLPPKDRHWSRKAYRLQDIRRSAKQAEMPINVKPAHWPTDPLPSCYALIAAQEAGFAVGDAAHAFLRACWAKEKDIAQADVVSEVLASSGVAEAAIASHMQSAAEIFETNTREAIQGGVFGAPFYVVGDERFWGHDRLDQLDAYLPEISG